MLGRRRGRAVRHRGRARPRRSTSAHGAAKATIVERHDAERRARGVPDRAARAATLGAAAARPDDPAAVQVPRARWPERDRSPARRRGTGRARSSVAVLLDENNTGNDAASMFEVAIRAGGSTGARTRRARRALVLPRSGRRVDRRSDAGRRRATWCTCRPAARATSRRRRRRPRGDRRRARAGARAARAPARCRRREATADAAPHGRDVLPASAAKTYGPATIYLEPRSRRRAARRVDARRSPRAPTSPEHVHANETELLYVLAGTGTMTVAGTALAGDADVGRSRSRRTRSTRSPRSATCARCRSTRPPAPSSGSRTTP